MRTDSVAADVAAAAAELAGQNAAPAQATDDTPAAGEQTAEALHGQEPGSGEHNLGKGVGRDELGRYTPRVKPSEKVALVDPSKKAEAPAKAADAPVAPVKPDAAKAEPEKPVEAPKPTEPALVAPRNWRPAAREKWAGLPREVQAEAIRVDREAQVALTKSTKEREFAGSIRETLRPYEHMLQAEGLSAPAAIGDLLKSAALLRTGTPQAKAAWAADTIKRFGISVEDLANALDGVQGQAAAQHQAAAPQFAHDPRLDRIIAQQEQMLAQQQQAAQAAAARQQEEIESFGEGHEFFDDVRDDMADELDRAAKRGKSLTLAGAYARVIALHKADPDSELGKVLRQRDEAAAAKASLAQSQQAKAVAAVSVKAEPAPVAAVSTGKGTARDDVAAMWELMRQR